MSEDVNTVSDLLVAKRNGKSEKFNSEKIEKAILNAMKSSGIKSPKVALNISKEIEEELKEKGSCTIDEIENLVYDKLIKKGHKLTAKAYEGYRSVREFQRQSNTIDEQINELLAGDSEYWKSENSNKDSMLLTVQRDYMAGIVSIDMARRKIFPPEIIQAHDEGLIHIHDLDYIGQLAMNNCFSRDTEFVTDLGVRKFSDFYDGDKIFVKDKDGVWREATVRFYGKQPMNDITITSGRTEKIITCTANHRWILKDGTVTTNLKVGDTLVALKDSTKYEPETLEELRAFCYGFVLGDGSDMVGNNDDKNYGVRVRLCGDKVMHEHYFLEAGYVRSNIKFNNGDIQMINKKCFSKKEFISSRGWRYMSFREKLALFNGYYLADGFKDRNGIATSNEIMAEMIRELSALAGFYITSEEDVIRSTPYKENARLITFRFMRQQPINKQWIVKSIIPHTKVKTLESWCVEEPVTHSFTLANGIVTGNCCLINLEDMLQNGTCINKTKIFKPHKLITATTIATQIITAVSSSQYGL